ncbi:hypothetical protein MXAZACID_13591 [Acidocella sp. MX-AZ02]|nr:hypothetical protein MXAZACID_13591 [Acidocella sp. MX-AZ02]
MNRVNFIIAQIFCLTKDDFNLFATFNNSPNISGTNHIKFQSWMVGEKCADKKISTLFYQIGL